MPLLACAVAVRYVSGRAVRNELRQVSEAGAAAEWAFRSKRRMITDAALYIRFGHKSEQIAKLLGSRAAKAQQRSA